MRFPALISRTASVTSAPAVAKRSCGLYANALSWRQ
jgi:hypothetical protein